MKGVKPRARKVFSPPNDNNVTNLQKHVRLFDVRFNVMFYKKTSHFRAKLRFSISTECHRKVKVRTIHMLLQASTR